MAEKQRDAVLQQVLVQLSKHNENIVKMQKEIAYLKQKYKLSIVKHLNSMDIKPALTLKMWIRNLPIKQRDLEFVFTNNLKDGILQVFQCEFDAVAILHSFIPLKAFIQKPKTLYAYNDENVWEVLDIATFKKLCISIGSRFLDLYLQWQKHNSSDNEEEGSIGQERDILFMKKVMDESYKTNVSIGKMMETIHNSIQTSFQQID